MLASPLSPFCAVITVITVALTVRRLPSVADEATIGQQF
jgi:hypothetical protein